MEVIQRIAHWLHTHLTLTEYIGLRLLVGLVVSVICLWAFASLAEDVVSQETLVRFDSALANALHAAATPPVTSFFLVITALGYQILLVFAVLVALFFLLRREREHLGLWIAALAGGEVLDALLKQWFARSRPQFTNPIIVALNYSFPSGHAMMSLIMYGLLAFFLYRSLPRRWMRVIVSSALILLILLIGFSRLYLGVHFFSDVVAGYAAGGLWLSACVNTVNFLSDRRKRREFTKA